VIDKNSNKFAEFVGILLGDGSLSKYVKSNHYRLQITLDSREKEYIKYISRLIRELFKMNPIVKFRKKENAVDVQIFNRKIIRELNEKIGLQYSPKWNRARIPCLYKSKGLEKNVLRGYFDTDGCVVLTDNNGTVYPRLEMKICPSPMQKQFIDILKRNNFKFGIYNIGKGKVRIQLNGKKQLKKWKEMIGFNNPRHTNKIKEIIS